jgi:hypothetical protein
MPHKRKKLTPSQAARVIERQNWICGCGCNERLEIGRIHLDHATPLWAGGSNDLSNFRALKLKHHLAKTSKEAAERARADRLHLKHTGQWLKPKDRELARIMSRTKQLET